MPGDAYGGLPDAPGSVELFHVLAGTLIVAADGTEITMGTGDSDRMRSDRPYRYLNDGSVVTSFLRVVALAR